MSRDRSSDGFVPFALHICRWKAKYQPRNDILRLSLSDALCDILKYYLEFDGGPATDFLPVSVVFRGQILYRYYKAYLQFRPICD